MAWPIPCLEAAFSVERDQQAIGFLFAEGEMAVPSFAKAQGVPLLQTKLHIPPVRPGLVSRPLLAAQLNQGVRPGHKPVLVSAPAGFGKTTLVNEWVHQVDAPVASVSLGKEDNDLVRLLTYLVAAIQAVEPDLTVHPCSVLPTGPSRATMLGGVLDLAAQPG